MSPQLWIVMKDNGQMYEDYDTWPAAAFEREEDAQRFADENGGYLYYDTVPYYR